jgi:hypothetical protein
MAEATGPPLPLGNYPNGVDISHPNYAIDSVTWLEPPKQFTENHMNTASMTAKTSNDLAYKSVGNANTWNTYILFGYHAYDHCFQFDTQWERMRQNQNDVLKFVWESYCYLISRGMKIPKKHERWAQDIAKPYLSKYLPTALTVDTTDPRRARRDYDEADLMDTEDTVHDKKLPANDDWTPVQSKQKHKPPNEDALATPLPATPPRNQHSPPTNIPVQQNTHPKRPPPNTSQKPGVNFVHVNDGTLRITVRWKPLDFTELTTDETKWNLKATDTIHYMLETVSDAIIYPWKSTSTTLPIPSLELNPENLLLYLAPKITPIDSIHRFVFSFRLCLSSGPGRWINDKVTKQNFEKLRVEVNISNASSDSVETISVAGYIFFKHPKFTQRSYYLSHLRRHLPAVTPYFDIGYHRKTPTGQDIPHLSIRCGENHTAALTEILSTFLDGTNTAVFLGQLLLSKMTTAEVDSIFQTHADYMANIRTISMAPTIQNVDIIRTETTGITTLDRNTRDWATSLTDPNGNSLQCDADYGGETKRAQILVPAEHMETVKQKFRDYKESISTFTKREADYTSMIQEASPPEAIHVPTAAVHSNLQLIQRRSSYTVWEQAPASVRSPTGRPHSGYTPPTQQSHTSTPRTQYPLFPNAAYPPPPGGKPPKPPQDKGFPPASPTPPQNMDRTTHDIVLTGDDTTTTHSQMTKSMTTTQNRFAEIEVAIR